MQENSSVQTLACSLVMPTKNAGSLFHQVLKALTEQTLWHVTEFIVIDSGSEDDTVALAKQAGAKIVEISPQEFNHGATRDYAISLASSEKIILLVQDAVAVDNTLLQVLVSALDDTTVAGVYARQIPQPDADILTKRNLNDWLTGRTEREERFIPYEGWYAALPALEKYLFCNFDNVCSAIKKSVWQQEPFGQINFGEDIDWAERVLKRGYHLVYEPQAAVIHSHNRPMSYEYKRTYTCHRKLYAMFGLHSIPSLNAIWDSWKHATKIDIVYVYHHEPRLIEKIKMLFKVPILNLLSIFGQYQAIRDEIKGITNSVKGV